MYTWNVYNIYTYIYVIYIDNVYIVYIYIHTYIEYHMYYLHKISI